MSDTFVLVDYGQEEFEPETSFVYSNAYKSLVNIYNFLPKSQKQCLIVNFDEILLATIERRSIVIATKMEDFWMVSQKNHFPCYFEKEQMMKFMKDCPKLFKTHRPEYQLDYQFRDFFVRFFSETNDFDENYEDFPRMMKIMKKLIKKLKFMVMDENDIREFEDIEKKYSNARVLNCCVPDDYFLPSQYENYEGFF